MADRRQDEFNNKETESIVGPSVKIEGDLKSNGNLRIDGTVIGKVKTAQNLLVGESANITADVEAENATIYGIIQGNVKISNGLVLGGTGKILGDINCGKLKVDEGAYFAGKCQMRDKPSIEPIVETTEK